MEGKKTRRRTDELGVSGRVKGSGDLDWVKKPAGREHRAGRVDGWEGRSCLPCRLGGAGGCEGMETEAVGLGGTRGVGRSSDSVGHS